MNEVALVLALVAIGISIHPLVKKTWSETENVFVGVGGVLYYILSFALITTILVGALIEITVKQICI